MPNNDFMKEKMIEHWSRSFLFSRELHRLLANLQLNNAKMLKLIMLQSKLLTQMVEEALVLNRESVNFDEEVATLLGLTEEDISKCKKAIISVELIDKIEETEKITEELFALSAEVAELTKSLSTSSSRKGEGKDLN